MPRVADFREIDGEIWVRIECTSEQDQVTIFTDEEITALQRRTIQNFLLDLYEQWKTRQ